MYEDGAGRAVKVLERLFPEGTPLTSPPSLPNPFPTALLYQPKTYLACVMLTKVGVNRGTGQRMATREPAEVPISHLSNPDQPESALNARIFPSDVVEAFDHFDASVRAFVAKKQDEPKRIVVANGSGI
jgi:hypothetical protein